MDVNNQSTFLDSTYHTEHNNRFHCIQTFTDGKHAEGLVPWLLSGCANILSVPYWFFHLLVIQTVNVIPLGVIKIWSKNLLCYCIYL